MEVNPAGGYQDVIRGLMTAVANKDQRPQWAQESFFRRYARTAGH
ncbi:MAG TPA: hypothetical protein VKV95_15390 [Terriglobia bacterium]|nr:hypothetical protein [Terriglobia bacterium]